MQDRKRIALVAILLAAGGAWSATAIAGDRMGRLIEELALFDDQIPQVEAILEDARADREALRESGSSADRHAARAEVREQLALVLTAEQMDKFDSLRNQRRSGRRQRKTRNESTEI